MTDDFPERLRLDVRLLPRADWPRATRMKLWLKRGLRDFGIRLVHLRPIEPEDTPAAVTAGGASEPATETAAEPPKGRRCY